MRSPAPRVVRGAKARMLRIIGGTWRGRTWRFPEGRIRPTPDRVRETLFNWLAPAIAGARCLDLFAGSGALGLEALSRGAARVVFVEHSAAAARELRQTLALWGGAARRGGAGPRSRMRTASWPASREAVRRGIPGSAICGRLAGPGRRAPGSRPRGWRPVR